MMINKCKSVNRYISYVEAEDDGINIRGYGYWNEVWADVISICPTPFFAKADACEYVENVLTKNIK